MSVPHRHRLLGLPLDLCTEPELTGWVVRLAQSGERHHSGHINLHAMAVARRDPEMARFYDTATVCPLDGMPVLWMARLCGIGASPRHRVTYIDWIRPLMRAAAKVGLRVYSLGGKPGVGERAAALLQREIPELVIATHHGYFDQRPDSSENREIVAKIRRFEPQLLLAGMGMPRQERWIVAQRQELPPGVSLAAGACMDYVAGAVPTPPRWIGRIGFEWLSRLIVEPRRLAWRYLVEPWQLALPLAREMLRRGRR